MRSSPPSLFVVIVMTFLVLLAFGLFVGGLAARIIVAIFLPALLRGPSP